MDLLVMINMLLVMVDFNNGDKDGMIIKLLILCTLLCTKIIIEKNEKRKLLQMIDYCNLSE